MKQISLPLYILNIELDRKNEAFCIFGATVLEVNKKLQPRFVIITMSNLNYSEIDYRIGNNTTSNTQVTKTHCIYAGYKPFTAYLKIWLFAINKKSLKKQPLKNNTAK